MFLSDNPIIVGFFRFVFLLSFFNTSFLSHTTECSGLVLCIFCSNTSISHFFKELFLFVGNDTRNQDLVLGVFIATGV